MIREKKEKIVIYLPVVYRDDIVCTSESAYAGAAQDLQWGYQYC